MGWLSYVLVSVDVALTRKGSREPALAGTLKIAPTPKVLGSGVRVILTNFCFRFPVESRSDWF
jgi:hypothetical protein